MTDTPFLSPAEVSQALGVSTSTIKRWVDQGVLPAHKTPGGHRKLLRADVLRLVREGTFPCLDLAMLALPEKLDEVASGTLAEHLFDGLQRGDITSIRGVIHGAYATGLPMEVLGDEVIAPAMARLGHSWEEGRIDVMHEHRGTLLCAGVLHELRPALEANAESDRPVAVGGNPEGDHSCLASLLVQLMLLDAGWDAINLGPNTPLASFGVAIRETTPRLVWLSACYLPDPKRFLAEYRKLYDQALAARVAMAVGGQALQHAIQGVLPATFHGLSLSELASFCRSLHPRPRPPKRGRPRTDHA
ncbi:MAG: helix-turn-helix domain-containing protein [Planctomycetes bacterium]|nr:helix-turn-helix domain-containing protein [Planctomycetota bacterium]